MGEYRQLLDYFDLKRRLIKRLDDLGTEPDPEKVVKEVLEELGVSPKVIEGGLHNG